MSVVRKFQTGGKNDNLLKEYQQFLAGKLNEGKITNKALPMAQERASQWYEAAKYGMLDNIKFDPLKNSYSLNLQNLPEELSSKV